MKKNLDKIKSFYDSNKQKINFFGGIVLVMSLIIIIIAVAVKIIGNKMSYEKLEDLLEEATYKYLAENPDKLPNQIHPTASISSNTLIENNYIKELKKYVKDPSCTANILVDYENNNYKYQAYLTCDDFKTEKFIDTIKKNNKISQTGEGLYEMNGELVFRGQNPNNYVKFANELWRIVKVDKSGNIRIIITNTEDEIGGVWDDRYNGDDDSHNGVNNYSLSRALTTTKKFFERKYLSYQESLAKYDLCVGKRVNASAEKSGNLECNELIKNQEIGLLPLYDYMNASLDGLCQESISKECQNYNYLAISSPWWTMTANGKSTFRAYEIGANGEIEISYTSYSSILRYVLALKSDILFKNGDGTRANPYQIR